MINFEYLSNAKITELRALQTRKLRQKKGLTFIEGLKAVAEAASTFKNINYIVLNDKSTEELQIAQRFAKEKQIPCFLLTDDVFKELTLTQTPQSIIAVVKSPENIPLQEVFDDKPAKILILDKIQDTGNVGTLVRSAAAFGVDYIITVKGTIEIANPKVVRAAAGLLWKMKFSLDNSIEDLIEQLQFNEYHMLIADVTGESYKKFQPQEPYALILSNEGNGLSEKFRNVVETQQCSVSTGSNAASSRWHKIAIQHSDQVESLNVAVAGSIILAHLSTFK